MLSVRTVPERPTLGTGKQLATPRASDDRSLGEHGEVQSETSTPRGVRCPDCLQEIRQHPCECVGCLRILMICDCRDVVYEYELQQRRCASCDAKKCDTSHRAEIGCCANEACPSRH